MEKMKQYRVWFYDGTQDEVWAYSRVAAIQKAQQARCHAEQDLRCFWAEEL